MERLTYFSLCQIYAPKCTGNNLSVYILLRHLKGHQNTHLWALTGGKSIPLSAITGVSPQEIMIDQFWSLIVPFQGPQRSVDPCVSWCLGIWAILDFNVIWRLLWQRSGHFIKKGIFACVINTNNRYLSMSWILELWLEAELEMTCLYVFSRS